MDSKIQQLTEAIYNEGIQKAQDNADAILNEAKAKAAQIEKDAQAEAEKLLAETRAKSDELRRHVESEIKMTLNQALSAIKQNITSLVTTNVIQPPVKELFSDKQYMEKLILSIVKSWSEKDNFDLNVILPEKDRAEMEKFFKNSLAAELNKGLQLTFSKNLKSGFKISPDNGSYLISFTDEDFINFLKTYLRPKSTQILFEEAK